MNREGRRALDMGRERIEWIGSEQEKRVGGEINNKRVREKREGVKDIN